MSEQTSPVEPGTAMEVADRLVGTALPAEEYKARRETILRFIKTQLTPGQYDRDGRILAVNDYYKIPGSDKLALSKKGAELIGQLYRYQIQSAKIVASEFTKDYGYARAEVVLHRSGIVVGAQSGSCSTAEASIQRAKKKYGGDFRSAMNDVEARAQKRAYVRAMIAACGASDILEVADDYELPEGEAEVIEERPAKAAANGGAPAERVAHLLKLMAHQAFSDEARSKAVQWVNSAECNAASIEPQISAVEEKVARWEEQHAGPFGTS